MLSNKKIIELFNRLKSRKKEWRGKLNNSKVVFWRGAARLVVLGGGAEFSFHFQENTFELRFHMAGGSNPSSPAKHIFNYSNQTSYL